MSTHPQRGRAIQRKQRRGPLPIFYIILALIAIVGIAAIGTLALRNRQTITSAGAPLARAPLNAPTGLTEQGYYYKGQPDAPVTVVEYADFQCPGCAFFATRMEESIDRDYVETGKVRFIYHDFPLQQHPNAIPAAEAARCAGDQNAFWAMHDMLFANQAQWESLAQPGSQFSAYAGQLKLDRAAFEQCLSSGKHRTAILQAQQESMQANINQTPTFVIDGKQVDATALRAEIDAALASKQ